MYFSTHKMISDYMSISERLKPLNIQKNITYLLFAGFLSSFRCCHVYFCISGVKIRSRILMGTKKR